MDSDNRQISANILLQLDKVVIHRLVNREKTLFTQGLLKLAKIDNPNQHTVFFLNMNSFYYTLSKEVLFAKVQYDETVSYLFPHFDSGISAITLLKTSPAIHNFEEILSNAAVLLNFDEAIQNEVVKQKIEENCPGVEKEPIFVSDVVKKTIKDTGKYLGAAFKTLGTYVNQGVQYVGSYLDQKIEEPQQKAPVNPETKQKWENLKTGTGNVLNVSKQLYSKYLSPLVNTGIGYGKDLMTKIEQSENAKIKYARELAGTSGQALGVAFTGLAEGAGTVGKQLGDQSRKLVNKKYGDDYVKTFLPSQETKEETPAVHTELKVEEKAEESLKDQEDETKPLYPYLEEKK